MPTTRPPQPAVRERCYQCYRPKRLCFCETIPVVDNRTEVLILQHIGERFHPFNTARIVRRALRRCDLIVDHNRRLGRRRLPLKGNVGLLYPHANARRLSDLGTAERPDQLVVIDGTWHQAKTIYRDVGQLRQLPCYRLTPSQPGAYRIRREPDAHSLSTLEATVAALRSLEPETSGTSQLLAAFHTMVEGQLEQWRGPPLWRRKVRRATGMRHLPRALHEQSDRLVVAYGEATPRRAGQPCGTASPVNWVAERVATGARFSCLLRPPRALPTDVLRHMRLAPSDFAAALSAHEFAHRWRAFMRRGDVLIVYHQRTCQLLQRMGLAPSPCLVLKAIFGKRQNGVGSLESLLAAEQVEVPPLTNRSRAHHRLAMAVALVAHLRSSCGEAISGARR